MTDNTQELDEILREMRYRTLEDNGLTVNGLKTIEQETKQALLDWHNKQELQARINERNKIALDNYRGKTVSESTNWQAKYEHFIKNNELSIKYMERDMKGAR